MGFSVSYLAVKNKAKLEILRNLSLKGTREFEEFFDSDYNGADLDNGWYLVVANEFQSKIFKETSLSRLSQGTELLTCMVEEHCMHSVATGWSDGKKIWSVYHAGDGDDNETNLTSEGDLPEDFEQVKEQMFAEQSGSKGGVDYIFDIPVALFTNATGFRYDYVPEELGAKPFEKLKTLGSP